MAAKKKSQGKQCAFFGCSNRMYDANSTFFSIQSWKKNGRVWENWMSRTSGKDGFVITNATRVCNVHFQQSKHFSCTWGQAFPFKDRDIATQMEPEAS